jgi:flagellar capping protein FliD
MADSSTVSSSELGGNRMTGLMSGLDTTALVEAMTSATLKRLEGQKAKSQKLTWQQEGLRDIIDKLNAFQEKYVSVTSSTSLRLRSNLMKTKATSTDDRVSATSNSSASAASYTLKAATAAKTTQMKSNGSISSESVSLDFTKAVSGKEYSVDITLDGNKKTVKFTGGANSVDSADNFLTAVNDAFDKTMAPGQTFELDSATKTKLTFNDGELVDKISHSFVVGYNQEAVGLLNEASSRTSTSAKLGDIAFKGFALDPATELYGFEINGVAFGFTKDNTIADIISDVNSSGAGATMRFDQLTGKITLQASESGAGGELELVQTSGNLLSKLLADDSVQFGASVSGKMSYDSYGAVSANLDADMVKDIGLDGISDSTVYELNLTIDGNAYTIKADSSTFPKKEVGGVNEPYKWTDFEKIFTDQIKEQYDTNYSGGKNDSTSYFAGFTVSADSTNTITFTDNNKKIEIGTGTGFAADPAKTTNVTPQLFNYTSVIANNNANINGKVDADGDGNIDARTIEFQSPLGEKTIVKGSAADGSVTIRDLVDSGLFTFDTQGYLTAKKDISATLGDAEATSFMTAWFGGVDAEGWSDRPVKDNVAITGYERGADATLTLKGENGADDVTYQNANDNFLINGTTINISGLGNFEAGVTSKNGIVDSEITVGVTKDTSAVKELITGFVEGYNQLLDDVREYYDTSRPKSSGSYYEPLTAAERKEMSKEEIDDWETQAKVGLLYNDKNLQKVLDDLHGAMNSVVNGFSNAAAGIELTDSLLDNNKFKVNEEKLDNALAKYGDKLADYFTDPENGLASKLNKAIEGMVSTSTNNSGYLVREAGVKGTPSELKSQMYTQLQNFQTMIDQITERYKKQQDSYWKRFTALETYLAKMNSQSSIFGQ